MITDICKERRLILQRYAEHFMEGFKDEIKNRELTEIVEMSYQYVKALRRTRLVLDEIEQEHLLYVIKRYVNKQGVKRRNMVGLATASVHKKQTINKRTNIILQAPYMLEEKYADVHVATVYLKHSPLYQTWYFVVEEAKAGMAPNKQCKSRVIAYDLSGELKLSQDTIYMLFDEFVKRVRGDENRMVTEHDFI